MEEYSLSYDIIQAKILEKLRARGCSEVTVTGYRYIINSIICRMKIFGYQAYCKEGGSAILRDYLEQNGSNQYYSSLKKAVCRMDDLLDGVWKDRHMKDSKKFDLNNFQIVVITDYLSFCESAIFLHWLRSFWKESFLPSHS